jgi:hypothetical protein
MVEEEATIVTGRLLAGTPVEVQDRFDFAFCSGFEVAATTPAGYRLRRVSDGVELPAEFAPETVREAVRPTFR